MQGVNSFQTIAEIEQELETLKTTLKLNVVDESEVKSALLSMKEQLDELIYNHPWPEEGN